MKLLLCSNREVNSRCGGIIGGGWEGAWPRDLFTGSCCMKKSANHHWSCEPYRDRWGERQHSCCQLLPVAMDGTKGTAGHLSSFSSNTMFTNHVMSNDYISKSVLSVHGRGVQEKVLMNPSWICKCNHCVVKERDSCKIMKLEDRLLKKYFSEC